MTSSTEQPRWQRSRTCSGGSCVEVAKVGDRYLVRDGKNPEVTPLSFSAAEWDAFAEGLGRGDFRFE
jgi:uncharacterized protein DUF397